MAEDKTQAAGKEAHDLAKDAKAKQVGESPDVALAAEGREASIERVDQLADDMESESGRRSSRRPEARFAGKSFVALHAILRNGEPVYPGDAVKFDADEDEHVGALLAAHVIVEGAEGSKDVKEALGKADLARGRALAQAGGV
jgi:hypothetical protein